MQEALLEILKSQVEWDINRLRSDLISRDELIEEYRAENRKLWAAVAYLKEACGRYDGSIIEAIGHGQLPSSGSREVPNECMAVAEKLLDGMVELKPE